MLLAACTTGGVGWQEPGPVPPKPAVTRSRVDEASAWPSAPAAPRDPPRVLTDPGSGVAVVWAGAAADAAVVGSSVVVLEPDRQHLSSYDWRAGEPRWRIGLTASSEARIHGLGDRMLLLHDGDGVTVIEAARGRVLDRHPAPGSGDPQAYELTLQHGACAWVGPCGIQALRCADAAPLGPYLVAEPRLPAPDELAQPPAEHGPACHPVPRLLGRYGPIITMLASVPASGSGADAGPTAALVGLDHGSGAVQWQHPLPDPSAPAGATDDGACWILDPARPRLRVHDCATGALRWERALGPGTLEVHGTAGTLVVSRGHGGRWRLSAYDTDDGEPRWSTRLARRQRPLFPEGPIPEAEAVGTRRSHGLIDPIEGRVVGELVAGRDDVLWRDPAGGFVLIGRDLRELDAKGTIVRQRPLSAGPVEAVLRNHLLVRQGEALEILDREQLRERARLEGRLELDASMPLPDDRLLMRRHGEDGVALVLSLQAPSRAGARRE